jgi:hypothetical protein
MVTPNQALDQHSYGGLAKRYEKHRNGMLECVDSLALAPVSFSTELHYENWLLHWLDSTVQALDTSLRPWACIDCGQRRSFKPHLVVRRRSGIELHAVCRQESDLPPAQLHSYRRIAQAHGAEFVLRPRRLIRSSVPQLRNLKQLRQRCTLLRDRPLLELQGMVLQLLDAVPLRVETLRTALGHPSDNHELDAVLARLCRAGLVSLNLFEAHYDHISVQAQPHRPRLSNRP